MTDRSVKLVMGCLLHDIGKVIFRPDRDRTGHGQSGYEFLKNELHVEDEELLDIVRCHHEVGGRHGEEPGSGERSGQALVYLAAEADRIAAEVDKSGGCKDNPFTCSMPLQSIFNRLNHNKGKMYYRPMVLDQEGAINYPTEEKERISRDFYEKIRQNLSAGLSRMDVAQDSAAALLELLEANLSYVPASSEEETDISLYDHLKLTAAVANCILEYLDEQGRGNYKEAVFGREEEFRREEAFLLYSMDVSGIQAFIYTIASKNALKTLRARSFYLEIMMEHIIDSLLQETGLSRANLLYSGGGHCYILMPNTKRVQSAIAVYMKMLNGWLQERFDISLYVAWGYASCSADGLRNVPEGRYGEIFRRAGEETGRRKSHRYTAGEIRSLNARAYGDYTRECAGCKRISKTDASGLCPVCAAMGRFSQNILYDDFFMVEKEEKEGALPLPGGCWLTAGSGKEPEQSRRENVVRIYGKNRMAGRCSQKLWVGDYTTGKTFGEYAEEAEGIPRIGILRADVDNLGQAFVSGFEDPDNKNRYVTLSRTAALSRQLSLFFKWHMNQILAKGCFSIDGKEGRPRNATICYSGGDDIFLAGSWNEVLELAVDIRRAFERYVQKTLTFSAGIGVYESGYPVSAMAREVAELEDASKAMPGKNAVTVFPDGKWHSAADGEGRATAVRDGTYSWQEFEEYVIGEKYKHIYRFFQVTNERGKNFLYNLLELIRNREDKINFARYVYLLSRLEPDQDADAEQKNAYREFSGKMYQWVRNDGEHTAHGIQLKTAIQLYAYLKREKEGMCFDHEQTKL